MRLKPCILINRKGARGGTHRRQPGWTRGLRRDSQVTEVTMEFWRTIL